MSEEIEKILSIMQSPVASTLLSNMNFTNYADYLSVGEKNGERMISFIPYPRNQKVDSINNNKVK